MESLIFAAPQDVDGLMLNRKNQASILRTTRKIHRIMGVFLFGFFILIALTALLLGWKKNSNGYLLPETAVRNEVRGLRPAGIDSLQHAAVLALQEQQPGLQTAIDRVDIRPGDGLAKVTFKDHYWEVQVDFYTGRVLQVAKRRSDFIENLHDASYFDKAFATGGDIIKLVYTTIMSLALLTFSLTGFWLWYGPRRMRRHKK